MEDPEEELGVFLGFLPRRLLVTTPGRRRKVYTSLTPRRGFVSHSLTSSDPIKKVSEEGLLREMTVVRRKWVSNVLNVVKPNRQDNIWHHYRRVLEDLCQDSSVEEKPPRDHLPDSGSDPKPTRYRTRTGRMTPRSATTPSTKESYPVSEN